MEFFKLFVCIITVFSLHILNPFQASSLQGWSENVLRYSLLRLPFPGLERGIFLNLKKTVLIIDAYHRNFSANIRHLQEFLLQHSFRSAPLLQRDFKTGVFCETCVFFLRTAFLWTPLLAASGYYFGFQVSVWFFMAKSFQYFVMKPNLHPGYLSFLIYIGRRQRCVICALSSSDIRACEVYEEYDVYTKQTLHNSQNMFPFILRISFASLNQSADYCRVVPINKRIF